MDQIYGDIFAQDGTYERGWWTHDFFSSDDYRGSLIGEGDKTYIDFPSEEARLMFLLKFGAN